MFSKRFALRDKTVENRIVFQPMEGFDCKENGEPDVFTKRKYLRLAQGGAGILWFEANAVCEEGRTNLRQMYLTEENADVFARLLENVRETAVKECGFAPQIFLQLTHSGRQSYRPTTMYRNEVYEARGRGGEILTDDYLDALPEKYAHTTRLAQRVGFDGVDVKACHGYLLSESLSAFQREGKYGGSFENRTRLFLNCIDAAKAALVGDTLLASRFGLSDMVAYPNGFATDENGKADLTETLMLLKKMQASGIELLNITVGNPYYNPHVNRPYKKGGYIPPETPDVGLARFHDLTAEVRRANPTLAIVGSGFTYYAKDMMQKAGEALEEGICDFVGFGRQILAYPDFYRDYQRGGVDPQKLCLTCSRCTELMRAGCYAGCAIMDEPYRNLYKENIACKKQHS